MTNIILEMRKLARLTQVELATKSGMGQSWISCIEQPDAHRLLGIATVCRIADACGVRVAYFHPSGWQILPDGFEVPKKL